MRQVTYFAYGLRTLVIVVAVTTSEWFFTSAKACWTDQFMGRTFNRVFHGLVGIGFLALGHHAVLITPH